MIEQMTIVIALLGFNDLGRSVTPIFLLRSKFYLQWSPHCPKMNKNSMWEVKKKFKISVHGTWNPAILRQQGTWNYGRQKRTFYEHHQLTKFTWQRTFPFKALIAIFWDRQPLWPSSLTKPYLLRFRCSSGQVPSKMKSVTPPPH